MSDRILLVDLGAVFHPVWHSVPPSEPAGTAARVAAHKAKALAGSSRSHVAICADAPRNWRYDLYVDYKANRESKTEPCIAQLRQCVELLRLDGFPVWLCDGFEADDIIATATREARKQGLLVTIASADKDMLQLIGEGVTVHSLKSGVDMGEPEVVAKFGVKPAQIADFLAIVGDKSDNVPGVPGLGAVKAADLLKQWGSLIHIMVAAEDETEERMTPKVRALLLEHAAALDLSRKLVGLRDDAPIDFGEALIERVTQPLPSQQDEEWDNDMDSKVEDAQFEEAPPKAEPKPEPKAETPPVNVAGEPARQAPPANDAAGDFSPAAAAQTSAITLVRPGSDEWSLALEPMNTPDAWKLAGKLFNARVFGGFPNQDSVFAAIMLGRTLGVPSVTIVRSVHIVEDKLTLAAQFIVGLVLKSGKADYFKCVKTTATESIWKTHRKDDPDKEPTVVEWKIDDARRAGLMTKKDGTEKKDGNWFKYPAQMLRWRASVDLARMVFPDIVGGLYSPEELDSEHHSVAARAAA